MIGCGRSLSVPGTTSLMQEMTMKWKITFDEAISLVKQSCQRISHSKRVYSSLPPDVTQPQAAEVLRKGSWVTPRLFHWNCAHDNFCMLVCHFLHQQHSTRNWQRKGHIHLHPFSSCRVYCTWTIVPYPQLGPKDLSVAFPGCYICPGLVQWQQVTPCTPYCFELLYSV